MKNYRTYGDKPFSIVVLHGGPGAPGEMAPVARELSAIGGVLEPLQITASLEKQILELHNLVVRPGVPPVTLLGWSWGAMLGYIFTARYPNLVKKLILVSSGVFDEKYALDIMRTRLSRLNDIEKEQLVFWMEKLESPTVVDKDTILGQAGQLIFKADLFNPVSLEPEILSCYFDTYHNVWQQAIELRKSGLLLHSGRNIICPVVALHGDYDPHPAAGIKEPLSYVLVDFRFILLEKCGHYPWLEKEARTNFYHVLKREISTNQIDDRTTCEY